MGKSLRKILSLVLLLAAQGGLSSGSISAQQGSLCKPVMDGAVLNVAFECWNESIFVKVDSSKAESSGWQYVADGSDDHDNAGDTFQIYGAAVKETSDKFCVVYNSSYPFDSGYLDQQALNGSVRWGDVFLNLSGNDFPSAHAAGSLYGLRFDAKNDSGVTGLGVFKNVSAKAMGSQNQGVDSRQGYENHLAVYGGYTPLYGDFDRSMSYYPLSLGLNEIDSAARLGDLTILSAAELDALGYNHNHFTGSHDVGFCFQKSLIIDECGVVGGDGSSCRDCAGVACGTSAQDACGVCGGNITSIEQCLQCTTVEATQEVMDFEKRLLKQAKTLRQRFAADRNRARNAHCKIALKPMTQSFNTAFKSIKDKGTEIFTRGVEVCGDSCVTASYAEQVEALDPKFKEMARLTKLLAGKVKQCYAATKGHYKGSGNGATGAITSIRKGLNQLLQDCRNKQICPPGSH